MNYLVADFITRLKNASMARKLDVIFPYSRLNKEIAQVLVNQGFLEKITDETKDNKKILVGKISYAKREPMMIDISVVSKPSLRVYTPIKRIDAFQRKGLHTLVISTNKGVMTGKEAKKKGVGGEILFEIW